MIVETSSFLDDSAFVASRFFLLWPRYEPSAFTALLISVVSDGINVELRVVTKECESSQVGSDEPDVIDLESWESFVGVENICADLEF